jgi:hypothetical protein
MKTRKMFYLFACLVVFAISAEAQTQSSARVESVAAVAADQVEVKWQPRVEYGRLILTVSAPGGEVYRKEFEAGAIPSFKLFDGQGQSLPDGNYIYELRVVPSLSREARQALAASREKGDTARVMLELQESGQLPAKIATQSGSFLIKAGAVLTGADEEGQEPQASIPRSGTANDLQSKKKAGGTVTIQDVVTADDIIVQGSACIGLDCVNNENFGFDSIRLKENNTRIQFDDTSTTAGFATNNWQIRANSSANGGASFLGFVDQGATGNSETGNIVFSVAAGSPTNSLFVGSTGRVGFRTATPVLDLHVATSDTPAFRFEQNATGGFTSQTWDVAGNEANFFVRDVTGGSRLPLRIRPGAPTSSLDISAFGNVGFGTQSPATVVHAQRSLAGAQELARLDNPSDSPAATADLQFRIGSINTPKGLISNGFDGTNFFLSLGAGNPAGSLVRILGNGNVGIGTNTPAGKLDVNGSIFQRGAQLFADYVFEPTYELESIEEHSAFMWENKHLPGVGERKVDEQGREVVEIGARMRGLLEELEKAHIYISTLNMKVTERDETVTKLVQQNAELVGRLAKIEALLSGSKTGNK